MSAEAMSEDQGTCAYVLDPGDPHTWGGEEGDECQVSQELLNEDGVWECPHATEEGRSLCFFHLPVADKDDERVRDLLVEKLEREHVYDDEQTGFKYEFIGSKFGRFLLPIDELKPSAESTIRLTHARFDGHADLSGIQIKNKIKFDGARFSEEADFSGVSFGDGVSFRDVRFDDTVRFSGGTFNKLALITDCHFTKFVYFIESEFNVYAQITTNVFDGKVLFVETKFNDEFDLFGSKFKSKVTFSTRFYDDANIKSVTFNSYANFSSSEFIGDANFFGSEFNCETTFADTVFNKGANFLSVDLSNTVFRRAELTGSNFNGATLKNSDLESALMSRASLFGADLRGAKLSGAVLGDVRINEDTKFLGRPNDSQNNSPHSLAAIQAKPCCVYDPDFKDANEETNISKAKSVYRSLEELAGKAARPRLQTQCFVRRQDIQKREYKRAAKEAKSFEENLIAGARWIRAEVGRATLLYGESPWRIIAGSIGFIIFTSLLYPLGEWLRPARGEPITYSRIIANPDLLFESFYFSTLTFTTLGMGGYEPLGFGQILATASTISGAVLVALLVFVLGRRAAR